MNKRGYLLLIPIVIVAFWQVFFLQNGMKWDFVDAFLPSRYFFTESILNNQFPLWNPYLLYGTPIYADLVSVFNPEFWIIGNMFGYSNITLQLVFLGYIFVAGVSFNYFLKQFDAEKNLAAGLSVAYMLSGFTVGHAQHVAFVSGYALIPFLIAVYIRFLKEINKFNLVNLLIALFLMIYCSYPALTIISGYLMLAIFLWYVIVNRRDKSYLKKLFLFHLILAGVVLLFSLTLIVAYYQISPFLSRFNGLPLKLAEKHPFSIQSFLSFLTPMAAGNDPQFFKTDISVSNGYFGIISLVLFLFAITRKSVKKESYVILFFAVFTLLASLGNKFFIREFLYNYFPLMNRFQYPGIFRAFTIFGLLAFTGINFNIGSITQTDRKKLILIAVLMISILLFLVFRAIGKTEHFVYFNSEFDFKQELFHATRFDNIIFQGIIQIFILLVFVFSVWKIKRAKTLSVALLVFFIADGVISTQLNLHYSVISEHDPVKFSNYLKSSPKGFPVPDLNPIGENSDRNTANEFTWMNNNVFPKKVTFDGLVSFKTDGYRVLSDNHPDLLEAIKKEPVVYFSGDVREDSAIVNFTSNTVFVSESDYKKLQDNNFRSGKNDKLEITGFSPTKIEIRTNSEFPQLLVYQQNYYSGWKVFVDEKENDLIKSNFTHMAVPVPEGEHTVRFEYTNPLIKLTFAFTSLIFIILITLSVKYFINHHPEKKKLVMASLISSIFIFILVSGINRYFYQKNKAGLSREITEKAEEWRAEYKNDIRILLSTKETGLKNSVKADATCFINEKNNQSDLSDFLMNSESRYFAFEWQGSVIGDDLFELIYSFYPEIIENKRGNNSGYVLLERGSNIETYKVLRTFEPDDKEDWMKNAERIEGDTVTGNHFYVYNENEEFGTSVEFPADSELLTKQKIIILSDFMIRGKPEEALLVFTTARSEQTKIYQTLDISRFAKYPGKWGRAVFEIKITPEIQVGDVIKIYFWNLKKIKFGIDNFKLKIS